MVVRARVGGMTFVALLVTGKPQAAMLSFRQTFPGTLFWLWADWSQIVLGLKSAHGPVFTSRYARVAFGSTLSLAASVVRGLLDLSPPDLVYAAF